MYEKSGSQTLGNRDVLLCRVVDYDGVSVMAGAHPIPLPPASGALLVAGIRQALKERARRKVRVDQVRKCETTELMIALWYRLVDALYKEATTRPMPRLRNTDGEDFVWTTDHFTLTPESRTDVEARLLALDGAMEDGSDSGNTVLVFTKAGNVMHRSWDTTTIGRADVSDTELKLQTNSVERGDALRRRVEQCCPGLVTHRLREHQSVEAMLEERRSKPAEPPRAHTPEEVVILRDFKEKHYEGWLDTPVPALSGKTPREAARNARSRPKLDLLLKEAEHHESRLPEAERFDFAKLPAALGLDRTAPERRP